MFRFIARQWARIAYVFRQETEAATNEINAGLANRTAVERRGLIETLNKEADEMDARIKEVCELEERGYWLCENGHEDTALPSVPQDPGHEIHCPACAEPMKLIKRDLMTGQEKYESDKERKDAEDMAKSKREQAKAEEENAANGEKTAKYFHGLAENNRTIAERIRQL
jgi:hypothetical protein